jgi:hypothetical protein
MQQISTLTELININQKISALMRLPVAAERVSRNVEYATNALYEFDCSLVQMNAHLSTIILLTSLIKQSEGFGNNKVGSGLEEAPFSSHQQPGNLDQDQVNGNEHISALDFSNNLIEIETHTMKAFDELSPSLINLKKTFDILGELNEGASGIGKLFAGIDVLAAPETVSIVAEIMAGAAGLAEAGAVFGPLGLAVGLGALIVGGIAATTEPEGKEEVPDIRQLPSYNKRHCYLDQEESRDRKKLFNANNGLGFGQFVDVNTEMNKDYMVESRMKRVDEALKMDAIAPANINGKWLMGDREKAKTPQLFFTEHESKLTDAEKLAIAEKNIREAAAFDSHLIERQPDMKKVNDDIAKLRKKNNVYKAPEALKEPVYRLPGEEEWKIKLMTEEYEKNGLPAPPQLNVRQHRKNVNFGSHKSSSGLSAGSVITINLNKPMIENFTINTRNGNEGMSEFKTKVEEVLLEILNSANVI